MGKRQSLQHMVLGKLCSYIPKNETAPLSYTIHKNILELIKDLKVRCETIKILEESTGSNVLAMSHTDIFPRHFSLGKGNNSKNILFRLHQIKMFCTSKEATHKTKRQPIEWELIIASDISDKGLVSKIYKECIKLNTQETI